MLGGEPTTAEIRRFLLRDDWQVTRASVSQTLWHLARAEEARVEVAEAGGWETGRPTRYRLTEAGRAWLAEIDGEPPA
jgi:DNA-binding PadR family transcriptional regulator